jgi:hypothetical protein
MMEDVAKNQINSKPLAMRHPPTKVPPTAANEFIMPLAFFTRAQSWRMH